MPRSKTPLDYISFTGLLGSLAIGFGGVIYCAFLGKNMESIRTSMKYITLAMGTSGGLICGAVLGAGTGFTVGCIGSGGKSKNEREELIASLTFKMSIIGCGIGGMSGLGLGFITKDKIYVFSKIVSDNVPRQVIIGTTLIILSTAIIVPCVKKIFPRNPNLNHNNQRM